MEKEIADRTVGGPTWPGGLDKRGTKPTDATQGPGTAPGGPFGKCCCCLLTMSCGR